MNIQRTFSIKGVGQYLPNTIVASSEIEADLGLPKNWINKFLGVESRHIAKEESNSEMGAKALQEALIDAKLKIEDIDCLIGASATFDYIIPNRSSMIKNQFQEAKDLDFPCLDINTVCTSFITAMEYASHLLQTNDYNNIAIVSSEISSKGLNPNNTKTYCLFGDGAAAFILSKTKQDAGLIKYKLKTYTESAMHTIIEGGGNKNHPKDHPYDSTLYSFKMEGRSLLKTAKKYLPLFFDDFYNNISANLENTSWIVPHQASKMGLKIMRHLNGDKSNNIVNYLAKYGNCIAASIPLALVQHIKSGKLKENDTCMLIGTSAGMSISGLLLKYTSL